MDDVLSRIDEYREGRKCGAGVLLFERRQFGVFYIIMPEQEAGRQLNKHVYDDTFEY